MQRTLKEGIQRYSIAICATIAAASIRIGLSPWLDDHVPFGMYLLAAILTAWLAGSGPAWLALGLGTISAVHFHIPPDNSLLITSPADLTNLFVYLVTGAVAILLFDRTSRQHDLTRGQLTQIAFLTSELQVADRRKDEFLALLAHELRNPLAPIRSGLEILNKPELRERQRKTVLRTICRQLEQLIHIVDDLLDVSRFMTGRIELDCQPVDLREVIETAIEQAQHGIEERQHDLQVMTTPHPVMVYGDRIRLVQILTNLVSNAAKYTPRQGRIQMMLEANTSQAVVHVIDNGIGIPLELQDRIFEMFSRGEAAARRDQGGLGLGLAIVKHFTEMHQGQIEVLSNGLGHGSHFSLTLPLASSAQLKSFAESPEPAHDHAPATQETTPEVSLPSIRKIMIVDDNRDASETLAALLAFEGYETSTVEDGPKALRLIPLFRPDVVLLDIGLPGMDGYQVARRLRSDQSLNGLRIIAVTGWGGEEDLRRSRAAGFDYHLVKPVDPDELIRVIRTVEEPSRGQAGHSPAEETVWSH